MAKRHKTDGRPTIAQVAKIAGVSVPTVSKVLNGRTDVAQPTREQVERVIKEYGFVRNRAARALRKGKTGLVDLILPRLDDEYYLPILEGVAQVLRETGVRLVLTSTDYQSEQEVQWIDTVTDHSTDGILLVLPSEEAIEHLEHSDLPFVLIHSQGGLFSTAPSVRITSWEGGFVATTHLIELGHRRIAYIGKTAPARDAIERIAGYRAALDTANLPIDPQLQCDGDFTEADGYAATRTLLKLPEPPTAIFAGNDRQAAARAGETAGEIGALRRGHDQAGASRREIVSDDRVGRIGFPIDRLRGRELHDHLVVREDGRAEFFQFRRNG